MYMTPSSPSTSSATCHTKLRYRETTHIVCFLFFFLSLALSFSLQTTLCCRVDNMMIEIMCELVSYYMFDFWEENGVDVMRGIFTTPLPFVIVVASYLWFVISFSPRFMSNRKPYNLTGLMQWYNFINIAINALLCLGCLYATRLTLDSWSCSRFHDSVSASFQILLGKTYTFLKVFDLLDTVFFALRKKRNQITTLHVVHHAIMPFTSFLTAKLALGAAPALTVILNTAIHTVMYYYYYLSSTGQKVWWKKYMTVMQLVQFYIVGLQATICLLKPYCSYPRFMSCLQLLEASYFIYSFSMFYFKAYEFSEEKTTCDVDATDTGTSNGIGNNNRVKETPLFITNQYCKSDKERGC